MSPIAIGIIGIFILLVIFVLRVPIAFSMAIVGVLGSAVLIGWGPSLNLLAKDFFTTFNSESLAVITMFVMMGTMAFNSGVSTRLYKTANTWVGQFRGGLTMATILGCAGFAAMCGSTTATAVSMGKIALPEMRKYKYNDVLATGCVAAAGTLGIMIPPSTIFIIYGLMTNLSIGKLFVAGILPGLVITAIFIIVVSIICWRHPDYGPAGEKTTWKEKLKAGFGFVDAVILFSLVIGGLLVGWFGPNEAGGIGAFGIIIIGLARRQLSLRGFISGLKDAIRASAMILCIIAGATVFGHFITISTLPQVLVAWLNSLQLNPVIIMAIICFGYFLGGCFMDSLPLIVLTVPIIYPIVLHYGFDPIWFGVIIVLLVEMGVITPPVGVNVYVIKGIAKDVPMTDIFKGIVPFLAGLIIVWAILMTFPVIATWLPSLITY